MLKVFWSIPNETHIHADSKTSFKGTRLSTTIFVRVVDALIRSTPRQSKQRDFHFASPLPQVIAQKEKPFRGNQTDEYDAVAGI
jgi:hypothetical protein